VDETRYLLDLAARTDFVEGVVGWVDLASADAPRVLEELRASPYFVGLRPMLQDLPDPRWVTAPTVRANLRHCAEVGVRVDWLVTPRELPWVAEVATSCRDLYYVVDHMGKPSAITRPWEDAMEALASHPRGYCKISGLSTWPPRPSPPDLSWKREAVERVWQWFGSERLMFGSDWPVSLSGGISYREAVDVVRRLLPTEDPDAWDAIFRKNAARFYRPARAP
jgi:L-fuconolactonase